MRLSSFLTLGLALTSLVTTPMVSADFRDFLSHPAASALPDPDITTSSITSPSAPTSSDIISQVVSHITTEEKKPKYGRKHKGIKKNPHHPSLPHLKLLLASPSSSSSSSNTGPVDELLNEDSDTLAAQENLDVGAMSSAGLDVTPSSSSSSAPPPPKVPAMAAAIMTQAIKKHTKHGHTHQHTPVSPEYRRHQPIMGTSIEQSIPSTSEQIQSIPSAHAQSMPISSSHVQSIPVSPFVRLTIATGRVNTAMEQLFADLRASLRTHDVMSQSMWRTSMSRPYTSNIMRIFPVGHDANVYISHAHTESSNQHVCRTDAQRLCSDIHGMIPTMACLSQHINQVSSECVNQIKTCSIMSCAHDIMQYCTSEQQTSRVGIMECLAASHDKLSEQCRATQQQHDTSVTSAAVSSASASTSAATSSDAAITPLSVVGIPSSPSSSSTSTTTLIISLSIVATVLLSLSIFLYMYLRRMSHEQEDVKLNVIQHNEMESETL